MPYDLVLRTTPDRDTPDLQARMRALVASSASLQRCELTWLSGEFPSDHDELEEMFEEGEASRDDYEGFCQRRGLDSESDGAASQFIEDLLGRTLLVVELPDKPAVARFAFKDLRAIAEKLRVELFDPQLGDPVTEVYTGVLPALYG